MSAYSTQKLLPSILGGKKTLQSNTHVMIQALLFIQSVCFIYIYIDIMCDIYKDRTTMLHIIVDNFERDQKVVMRLSLFTIIDILF